MRLALLALCAIGCRETDPFVCATDDQCRRSGTTGVCEPEGCAFADPGCPSGLRYDGGACLDVQPAPNCDTWHAHHFDACAIPVARGPLELAAASYRYDTDTGELTGGAATAPASIVIPQSNPGGDPIRVIAVDSFRLDADAELTVIGSLPLVIAATTTIDVTTSISVTAGANPASCATSAGGSGAAPTGAGGGGFAGRGGAGGDVVDVDANVISLGGVGGTAISNVPDTIRGGCPGGASAPAGASAMPPSLATTIGRGGNGGGAIALVARTSITVNTLIAVGKGGFGSPENAGCGAGGGGSGGYLELDAPIVSAAFMFANGGGGGGASDNMHLGGNGAAGSLSTSPASGGVAGAGCGTAGATGTAGTTKDAGNAPMGTCATGGGGGGIGFIVVHSPMWMPTPTAVISPAAIVTPD